MTIKKYAVFEAKNNIFAIVYDTQRVSVLLSSGQCNLVAIVRATSTRRALVEFGKIIYYRFCDVVKAETFGERLMQDKRMYERRNE